MSSRPHFKVPDFPRDRPTVPEALALVRELYSTDDGVVGCCLHIVLDDGNLGDDSIRYCMTHAEHGSCAHLAAMLLKMSPTQRRKVYRSPKNCPTFYAGDLFRFDVASPEQIAKANTPEMLAAGRFCIPITGWFRR